MLTRFSFPSLTRKWQEMQKEVVQCKKSLTLWTLIRPGAIKLLDINRFIISKSQLGSIQDKAFNPAIWATICHWLWRDICSSCKNDYCLHRLHHNQAKPGYLSNRCLHSSMDINQKLSARKPLPRYPTYPNMVADSKNHHMVYKKNNGEVFKSKRSDSTFWTQTEL